MIHYFCSRDLFNTVAESACQSIMDGKRSCVRVECKTDLKAYLMYIYQLFSCCSFMHPLMYGFLRCSFECKDFLQASFLMDTRTAPIFWAVVFLKPDKTKNFPNWVEKVSGVLPDDTCIPRFTTTIERQISIAKQGSRQGSFFPPSRVL